ncbi:RNB-domain-containing protein [Choiromyces venosus 120613-1]|uniref:Chromosome disjunction protein 3 n=1 Tax=Choiromyces venosus 120613-1 TaxID=1336337 RepID=A0A3N4ITN6_9PEZI|nr:RNB-domain-containing protein [Choiromyces venosus 120613-1]
MTSFKRSHADSRVSSELSSKVFLRTSKGKCTKIVRELYLRRDIPCSSKLCARCMADIKGDSYGRTRPFVLSSDPPVNDTIREPHYMVPDTNIFLHCMDVLEHAAITDVIILQTVLDEVRARSLPLYNRLRALVASGEKRFYVFHNEFRSETYVRREPGETINDRNDRAVRRGVQWYHEHLKEAIKDSGKSIAVVMVSNDKGNLEKGKSEGVTCCNIKDYVSGMKNSDELLDMISAALGDENAKAAKGDTLYSEYYSMSKMMTGVKAGTLHQGKFNLSPYNFLEGSIHVPSFDKPLLILGRENINRSVHGDQVVVRVLPKDQWKQPSTKIVEEETLTKNDNPDVSQGAAGEGKPQPTARVVGVIKRNWRYYVGHLDPSSVPAVDGKSQRNVFLIPMDKKIPKIRLRTRQASELFGKRIVVSIDAWERTSRYPSGHFVRSLGEVETKEAETEALLLEWDVQYRPFPKAVLDCLPKEGHEWRVPQNPEDPRLHQRADYRGLLVCSIDPPGCQDIDDALHASRMPNGNYEVGVHIADVTHFVKPNTAMDDEASVRGTTVYLVDKRIDMLPMLLGTDLCSLKPYVERFAFSVIWEITEDGEVVSTKFSKSIIKSREAFSYEQAQIRIDDQSQTDELTQGMRTLLMLSKKLRQKRMDAGALNLASPEVKIETESETSDPIDVKTKKMLETNSLVEEFMLLANISVAGKIYEAFPQTAMLRRHGAPPASKFEELQSQLNATRGLTLRTESSKALADSLDECVDPANSFFNTLVRILATRCMLSAEYFCSGTQAYPEFRHYGLASEIYTHFTSPIRRYADVVAHRQLAAAIEYEALHPTLHSKAKLEGVCGNINNRHRNAQMAGRSSVEYYVGQALRGKVIEEEGYIMRIFSNGLVVFVPRFGVEGLIRVKDLATVEPKSEYDAEKYTLMIEGATGAWWSVGLFDKVVVKVMDDVEAHTGKRKIKMTLVSVKGLKVA